MAQFQLPAPPPFQPHGDPTSVAQRWTEWKKEFVRITGPDTQGVFKTLTDTGTEYQHALNKLDAHFSIKKNVPFGRSVFHSTTQHKSKSIEQFVTHL